MSKKNETPNDTSTETESQTTGEATSNAQDEELRSELEAARQEVHRYREHLQRTAAEYDNFRKQVEKRRIEDRKFTTRDLIYDLLPIVDNFEAALKAAEEGQDPRSVLDGVRMIHGMLMKLLADYQVEEISPSGEKFDPASHEAVAVEPRADVEPNRVLDVAQKGYRMGDMVIRHARVSVSAPHEHNDDRGDEEDTKAKNDD